MAKVVVNGIALDYAIAGPDGAPVIAFANSLGGTAAMWDAVTARLAGRYRCLTYDNRGHGRSGTSDRPTSIDDLAADLAAILAAAGLASAHVVGLSLGGMIAQALAAGQPDRVDRLVLVATAPYLPPAEAWRDRAATVRAGGMAAVADAVVARWFTAPFYKAAPQAVAAARQGLLACEPKGYARCAEAIAAMDLRPRLAAIRAPTLVIAGAEDPVVPPAMAEALRAGVPGAELAVLAGAAHLISVERPDALADLIARHVEGGAAGAAFDRGLAIRRAVLGTDYVATAIAAAGAFGAPWQDFITRIAWGEVWGDATLPGKTRSLLTLALTAALNREEEFKLHVRPALANGVTPAELRALLFHVSVYAGVPAANGAFRWLREVLGEELG
jgi:3-oxoadipate enol-lactonase/4-carboxymuconolactone decarboxylase